MEILVGRQPFCDYATIQAAVDALEIYTVPLENNIDMDQSHTSIPAMNRNFPADAAADPPDDEADRSTDPSMMATTEMDTIRILEGIYEESVIIYRSNLRIIGIGSVEITACRHAREKDEQGVPIGTFATPTLFVGGSNLLLENLTISNTAGQGEGIGQAVAVYAHSDRTVFRRCILRGHQDTLFTGPLPPRPRERASFGGIPIREHHARYRQLYEHCYIEGTVDFIFGGATAYFDHCQIHSLRHYRNRSTYITAASTPQDQPYGYVLYRCYLTGERDIAPVYLGRPWREYARTVLVECRLGDHIHPAGWHNWDQPANEQTVTYQEYDPIHAEQLRADRAGWADCLTDGADQWTREHVFAGTSFWNFRNQEGSAL
ncbi:pectinesterase family protein [Paenibacillus wulumuqiensis]|uniref:pectinesterase family protein n=1 Tax=Paenibacillus wulumuqiensis TaxID=1567107 RepID=UPI0009E5AF0B|nr:pectinesterase family protein [Paenibacillus wulumuqiensis]